MVFEATYLVAVLTAGQMSLCCGQNCAQRSKVLRPSNKSNGMFICFLMAVETTGSECGPIHPPYAKPPLVSSSGPPGACMTPSRETNSSTLTFLMRTPRPVTLPDKSRAPSPAPPPRPDDATHSANLDRPHATNPQKTRTPRDAPASDA